MDITPGSGFLSPNKYHQKGDKKPCLNGSVNIGGIYYEVAVWAPKPGKNSYFAKFTLKEEKAKVVEPEPTTQQNDKKFEIKGLFNN